VSNFEVVFSPEAEEQLTALYEYIAEAASPDIAYDFTEAIVAHCEKIGGNAEIGIRRDDIRPNLRITHFRGRTIIAFSIMEEHVTIIGVFYGGRNYEATLHSNLYE
jgi:toxin ParE1/3/4